MDETLYESRESMPWYQSNDLDQDAADAEWARGEQFADAMSAAYECGYDEDEAREYARRSIYALEESDDEADRLGAEGLRSYIGQLEGLLRDLALAYGAYGEPEDERPEAANFLAAVKGVVQEWQRICPENQG